jgi:hypothetical protein
LVSVTTTADAGGKLLGMETLVPKLEAIGIVSERTFGWGITWGGGGGGRTWGGWRRCCGRRTAACLGADIQEGIQEAGEAEGEEGRSISRF